VLDFVLGAILVALAVRGWMRGFAREAIGLAVILAGLVLAFRLSTPVGAVVEAMSGASPDVARLIGGVIVFLTISVGAAVISWIVHKGLRIVPGLTTINRVAGAGLAILAGVFVATVAISLLAVLPVPAAVADELEASSIAGALTDPEGMPQSVLGVVSGDRVISTVISLQDLFGERRVVGDETVVVFLPSAKPGELATGSRQQNRMIEFVNRERIAAGVDPVVASEGLSALAEEYARQIYTTGRFSHVDADGMGLDDRLDAAGVPTVRSGEVLALGISPKSVHEGIMAEPTQRAILLDPGFRSIGVGAIRGPLGLLIVEILTG
jgi:uncharacterized membrane protein required for colicin V production